MDVLMSLNAYIGHIYDHNVDEKTNKFILAIQNRLFDLGSNIAYDQKNKAISLEKITQEDVEQIESEIDRLDEGFTKTHQLYIAIRSQNHISLSYC